MRRARRPYTAVFRTRPGRWTKAEECAWGGADGSKAGERAGDSRRGVDMSFEVALKWRDREETGATEESRGKQAGGREERRT